MSELGIGGKFGDFELLEEIAQGGMGVVFKARQNRPSRVVALKTIRPSVLRPGADAVQRFRIEAEAVARLDHPNIVPIFEMGEIRGFPFLSFKLIDGGDLRAPYLPAERGLEDDGRAHGPGRPGRAVRASPRDSPPRPEALEHPAGSSGPAACHGFRPGQVHRGRQRTDGDRADPRYAVLHGPGAGLRPARRGDDGRRCLRSGRRALRPADGPSPVPGRDDLRDPPAGPRAGAGPTRRDRPLGRSRSGGDLPEVPGERPGSSLRLGRGGGGRPRELARRRHDRGTTGGTSGASLAVVPTQPSGRPTLGGRCRAFHGGTHHRDRRVRPPAWAGQ